ncbi:hypothetical protein LINPERHAP2_LOCUS24376, partial [Linum perenne]
FSTLIFSPPHYPSIYSVSRYQLKTEVIKHFRKMESSVVDTESNTNYLYHSPAYEAALKEDWATAAKELSSLPQTTTTTSNILQLAVLSPTSTSFLRNQLSQTSLHSLRQTEHVSGNTLLHSAAAAANLGAARVLLGIDTSLTRDLISRPNAYGDTPVHCAAAFGNWDLTVYLLSLIFHIWPHEDDLSAGSPLAASQGVKLLQLLIAADFYDSGNNGTSSITRSTKPKGSNTKRNFHRRAQEASRRLREMARRHGQTMHHHFSPLDLGLLSRSLHLATKQLRQRRRQNPEELLDTTGHNHLHILQLHRLLLIMPILAHVRNRHGVALLSTRRLPRCPPKEVGHRVGCLVLRRRVHVDIFPSFPLCHHS